MFSYYKMANYSSPLKMLCCRGYYGVICVCGQVNTDAVAELYISYWRKYHAGLVYIRFLLTTAEFRKIVEGSVWHDFPNHCTVASRWVQMPASLFLWLDPVWVCPFVLTNPCGCAVRLQQAPNGHPQALGALCTTHRASRPQTRQHGWISDESQTRSQRKGVRPAF